MVLQYELPQSIRHLSKVWKLKGGKLYFTSAMLRRHGWRPRGGTTIVAVHGRELEERVREGRKVQGKQIMCKSGADRGVLRPAGVGHVQNAEGGTRVLTCRP